MSSSVVHNYDTHGSIIDKDNICNIESKQYSYIPEIIFKASTPTLISSIFVNTITLVDAHVTLLYLHVDNIILINSTIDKLYVPYCNIYFKDRSSSIKNKLNNVKQIIKEGEEGVNYIPYSDDIYVDGKSIYEDQQAKDLFLDQISQII